MATKVANTISVVTVNTYQKRVKPRKHYVFQIEVTWTDDNDYYIFRRYSEFYAFHDTLVRLFSKKTSGEKLPSLPSRIFIGRSHVARVAEARLDTINKYCQALIRMPPEVAQSNHVLGFFSALPGDIQLPKKDWKRQPSLHPLKVPTGSQWDELVVTKEYTSEENSKQLSVKIGDIVKVLRRDDSGWWMVLNSNSKVGWVPSSYLGPISRPGSPNEDEDSLGLCVPDGKVIQTEDYKAIDDYEAEDSSQVTLKEGDSVTVIDKEEDGWWFVAVERKEGWAPCSYLEPKRDAKSDDSGKSSEATSEEEEDNLKMNEEAIISKYGKNPPYKTTNGYKAQDADELSIEEGKTVEILKKSISGWWIVKYNSKIGLFPATYLQELDSEGKYYRSVPESQKRAVPRKKTIVKRKTLRKNTQEIHLGEILEQRSTSSSEESDSQGRHRRSRAIRSRSKSPALPLRPRETVVRHALSPVPAPRKLSLEPSAPTDEDDNTNNSSGNRSRMSSIESTATPPKDSRSDSLASVEIKLNELQTEASLRPSSVVHSLQTNGSKQKDNEVLLDALLKLVLQTNNIEMKAKLADLLISNPSLAEKMKEIGEQ